MRVSSYAYTEGVVMNNEKSGGMMTLGLLNSKSTFLANSVPFAKASNYSLYTKTIIES
jgi:hypothetical protein